MLNVVISYSHKDADVVDKLEKDLKNQNINLWIDKKSIAPGDIWIKEIDEALRKADFVLAIMTKNYLESYMGTWETYATLVEKLRGKGMKWVPLYFNPPENLNLPPLIGSIQGIKFVDDYDAGLIELLQTLSREESPKNLLATIEGLSSVNPFRRVRAEFFDKDYKLLARAFYAPEKERYDKIKGRTPIIIFGGRGSGKTMVLKSMSADIAVARTKKASYKESGLDYFGLYVKLTRGCFTISDQRILDFFTEDKARLIFVDDFYLKLTKDLIDNLRTYGEMRPSILTINSQIERTICETIAYEIDPEMRDAPKNFRDLAKFIDIELRKIRKYVAVTIMGENPEYPGFYLDIENFLSNICKTVLTEVEDLHRSKVYFLLDEYENLMPFQQKVVNTLVKLDTPYITIKIASKFEGMHRPPLTLFGQALQEGHDYDTIELDYELSDEGEFSKYKELLRGITYNILEAERFQVKDICKLLNVPVESEVQEQEIMEELERILRVRGKDVSLLTQEKKREFLNHLSIAIVFRLLRKHGRRRGKSYAGFDTLAYLSSGIVRFFMSLCGMAFYRAEADGTNVKAGEPIPPECQKWAAYIVSEGYLEKIASNLEQYGELTQHFVMDIGDIFRERLLFHCSEPEVLAISIRDPHNLSSSPQLDDLLHIGVMESVFQKKKVTDSYRPKVSTDIRPIEYILNRIYTPALEISYRPRWRCNFTVQELTRLMQPWSRKKEKVKLQKRQHTRVGKKEKISGPKLPEFT